MEPGRAETDGRLDAFVDAAFAFAVTLLIIAGNQPLQSVADLTEALRRVPAFAVSFALIGLLWSAHRTYGRLSICRDGPPAFISLTIVFTVLIYVFPLRLLAESALSWASGGWLSGNVARSLSDLKVIFVAYGAGFAVLALQLAALYQVGRTGARSSEARGKMTDARDAWLICAATGLGSVAIACSPLFVQAPWAAGALYWAIPIGLVIRSMVHAKKSEASLTPKETCPPVASPASPTTRQPP